MKKTYLRRALICGLALSTMGYTNAFAEEAEQAVADDLGEVVVTAERMSSKKLETPANVVVISDKEIADNHYEDLAEALEHVNGVTIVKYGGGQLDYVTINGDTRVVLLVDGQRMNNDQGGLFGRASVELNTVPSLENVQRIEIVKGGASALYGSDAVGGVINVITKKHYEEKKTLDLSAGTFHSNTVKATYQGNQGEWDWFVSGSTTNQGDYEYKDFKGNNQTMKSSGFSDKNVAVKLRNTISDSNSVTLMVNRASIDGDTWSWYNGYNYDHLDVLYTNIGLTYAFKEDKAVPAYVRYFNNYKDMDLQGKFSNRTQGIDYQDGWQLNDKNTLVVGAEYHWSSNTNVDGGCYDGEGVKSQALYIQDTYAFADKWLFVPGVRIDHHSKFGTHWSPKVAVNYKADDNTNIYANWGKVFKAPTSDDLYYNNALWEYYGNKDLKPETGWTATLGMNHRFDKKNSMDMSLFKSDLTDAIDWVTDYSTWKSYATNIHKEKKQGMEINFKSKLTDNWTVNGGYSYTRVEKDSNLDISNPQPNGYRLGVAYKNRDVKANLNAIMANGLSTARYAESRNAVLNFNASYTFRPNYTLYFKALNLTNQHYAIRSDKMNPAPGRFFQIGATYSF